MGKYKYLAKNVGVLALSQFGTKILSFFLVPLYTSILTTAEYGIFDLFYTTVSLLIPFLTLNIVDSTLRFTLDKENNNGEIFSISVKYIARGSLIVFVLLLMNWFCNFVPSLKEYGIFLWLLFVLTTVSGLLTNFARGIDKVTDVAVSSVLCSVVLIFLNIIFLIPMGLGLLGYFWANILGLFAQVLYLCVRLKVWNYFKFEVINKNLEREMLDYCKPMIINGVAWWINSTSDRYAVTLLCGVAINGIYSVGYKIPSILNIFQTIFSQAWTLSAVHDFDSKDSSGFFSRMYNMYNMGMTIVCSILIISARILAKILYAKDFFGAWKYVPFLLIGIVFGALSGYIGGIFAAVKNSKIFAKSSMIGALINLILNFILVHFIGALGAAISTAISYWVVWVIRVAHMKKYMEIKLFLKRDYTSYFILLLQSIMLICFKKDGLVIYLIEAAMLFVNVILYRKEIFLGIGLMKKVIKKKI